jgi:hypothetical protein
VVLLTHDHAKGEALAHPVDKRMDVSVRDAVHVGDVRAGAELFNTI